MTVNMRPIDRIARLVVAGLAVWPALVVGPSAAGGVVILLVATILTVTGISGYCPLYQVTHHLRGHGKPA